MLGENSALIEYLALISFKSPARILKSFGSMTTSSATPAAFLAFKINLDSKVSRVFARLDSSGVKASSAFATSFKYLLLVFRITPRIGLTSALFPDRLFALIMSSISVFTFEIDSYLALLKSSTLDP